MAIVAVIETAAHRGVSGRVRESSRYTRSFMVKTDDPAEAMTGVIASVGIQVGDYHPEDTSVIATQFDCKPTGDLLMFEVVWSYEAPPLIDAMPGGGTQPPPGGGGGLGVLSIPGDVWSGGTSVSSIPCVRDRNGTPLTNTAGTPIPDVQQDFAFATLQLTRCYTDFSVLQPLFGLTNTVNSTPWAGGAAGTWKCQGGSWSRESQSTAGITLTYYKATISFAYDHRGWLVEQVSVGYQELSGGSLVAIKDSEGNPVTEPRALNANGAALPPGSAPIVLQFAVYVPADFANIFGAPV